jgi:hypothetical protein
MTQPPNEPSDNPPGRGRTRAVVGVALALVGSLILCGLIAVTNCTSDVCQKTMFDLGLALTSLISGGAQVMILVGLWLLWTTRRRPPS